MSRLITIAFICSVLAIEIHSLQIVQRCVPVGNTAYFVSKIQLDFNSAKKYCEGMNSKLVTLDDASKAATVYNILKKRDGATACSSFYWIGAQDVGLTVPLLDRCSGRNFIWLDNDKCLSRTTTEWCTDEPNRDYEKCVDVEAVGNSYCWADVDCSFNKFFICERSPQEPLLNVTANVTIG